MAVKPKPTPKPTLVIHFTDPAARLIVSESVRRGLLPGELVKLAVTSFLKHEKELISDGRWAKKKKVSL